MEPVKVVCLDITERTVPNRVRRTVRRVSVTSLREPVFWVVKLVIKDLIVAKVRDVLDIKAKTKKRYVDTKIITEILDKMHRH